MSNGKRTTLVSGAEYHNFEENPVFKGRYLGECHGHDEEGDEKVIGFYFADEDGEEHIVPNSFAIEKALNTDLDGTLVKDSGNLLEITFLGKVQKKGKPFNRFNVVMIS